MQNYFENFAELIEFLKSKNVEEEAIDSLKKIFDGMHSCGKKIFSATKFIDFFVHDILDYTILNKEQKNFVKNVSVFDIRESIQEIMDIQEDKINMKNITVERHFKYFTD
jgi:hypothetical protein